MVFSAIALRFRLALPFPLSFSLALSFLPVNAMAQNEAFVGKWLLALETARNPDYGVLEIAGNSDELQVWIDGGSVNLLHLDGNEITFDFDWTDGGDRLHVSELSGELRAGRIGGTVSEGGEPTGTWSAERWAEYPGAGAAATPVDLSGLWRSVSRGTHKDAFDLTPAGEDVNRAYDPTLDDPHLRCVAGGTIRMEDGPFDYLISNEGDHLLIRYHYFNEMRRIWTDGRNFPEAIEDAWLPMGYSIGHWEGASLVVETRGMKPTIWDASGMPISPKAVLFERKYIDEDGRLHTNYELHDPAHYERPIHRHAYRELNTGAELEAYACDPHSFYRNLDLDGTIDDYFRSRSRF